MTGRAYYNEFDPFCAAWLRNLIAAGLIVKGDVDERDIREVRADDLKGYCQVHLFAGIGGWPLALRLAGWPDDRPVWTGSVPCQPFSTAGKRQGVADKRHLWPEMFRLVREHRPDRIFGEQVASAVGHGWLDGVFGDLEAEGYACGAVVLGAHSVGAPHIRQRLWWVASTVGRGCGPSGATRGRKRMGKGGAPQDIGPAASDASTSGGLADGLGAGLEGRAEQPAREERPAAERSGDAGGLADAELGRGRGDEPERGPEGRVADGRAGAGLGGLGNTAGQRPSRGGQDGTGEPPSMFGAGLEQSPWSNFAIVQCRDGKARRIPAEPGLFPLAHGVPGRVGRLRAYGNAINPYVAAAFVRAATEAASGIGG